MDNQRRLSLLNRQLTDLQAQADRILNGSNSPEVLETFARFGEELKQFIVTKLDFPQLREKAIEIPPVNYERVDIKIWQYILAPSWWISIYRDYKAREAAIEEVRDVRGQFADLQLDVQDILYKDK